MPFSFPFLGATTTAGLSTQVWPTANTIISGAVTNPSYVYDQSPTTAGNSSQNSSYSVQGWGAVSPSTATLYVVYDYDIVPVLHGSGTIQILASYNGGTTYTDTVLSASTSGAELSASGTATLIIDPGTDLSQVRIKYVTTFTGGTGVSMNIYQTYIQY